jgi:hypothetical protein
LRRGIGLKSQENRYGAITIKNLHRSTSGWDEDFLTEAFVHLLRLLQDNDSDIFESLLRKITGDLLDKVDADVSEIEISTQFDTKINGIPDIRLNHPDFLVLIEVKVDAGFHDGQLEGYRLFLDKRDVLFTRLITLTRYGQSGDQPEVDLAIRWNQIADWLEKVTLQTQPTDYLRNEFVDFLKIRGVAMDKVNWTMESGLTELQNFLNMIAEALAIAKIKTKSTAGTSAGGYQGFFSNTETGQRIYICVYFNQPAKLFVHTEKCNFNEDMKLEIGKIVNKNFEIELNLASEEVHFFARSKQSQLTCLEEFLSESVKYAEKLILRQ